MNTFRSVPCKFVMRTGLDPPPAFVAWRWKTMETASRRCSMMIHGDVDGELWYIDIYDDYVYVYLLNVPYSVYYYLGVCVDRYALIEQRLPSHPQIPPNFPYVYKYYLVMILSRFDGIALILLQNEQLLIFNDVGDVPHAGSEWWNLARWRLVVLPFSVCPLT